MITIWGGGDYQLRSALAAKQIWVAVITIWGTLDSLPPQTYCLKPYFAFARHNLCLDLFPVIRFQNYSLMVLNFSLQYYFYKMGLTKRNTFSLRGSKCKTKKNDYLYFHVSWGFIFKVTKPVDKIEFLLYITRLLKNPCMHPRCVQ